MSGRTLLERLRKPGDENLRRAGSSVRDRLDSVLGHLQRMLNTRQGNAPAVPDYGVPDLSDIVREFPESRQTLEQAIRRSIERYEPRLADVRVRYAPSEKDILTLTFEVTARLLVDGSKTGISFVTRIDPDGRVDVK